MRFLRLKAGDRDLARDLFLTLAQVFDEGFAALSDDYIDRLLTREEFWAIAALDGGRIAGGLTAHTLPLTRTQESEVFIYDIAVRREDRRRGVGRRLVAELQRSANARGIRELFVPADNGDIDALDFYRALGGTPAPVTMFTFTRQAS